MNIRILSRFDNEQGSLGGQAFVAAAPLPLTRATQRGPDTHVHAAHTARMLNVGS